MNSSYCFSLSLLFLCYYSVARYKKESLQQTDKNNRKPKAKPSVTVFSVHCSPALCFLSSAHSSEIETAFLTQRWERILLGEMYSDQTVGKRGLIWIFSKRGTLLSVARASEAYAMIA